MNKTPLVSVNIPLYNRASYIHDCIQSVLNQTYNDFEIVVLDDGSTDQSAAIVQAFNDPRIRYFKNDTNRGISYTRNKLVSLSRGEYIAVLDSDDLAEPERLKLQLNAFQHDPNLSIVSGCVEVMNEQSESLGKVWGLALNPEECRSKLPFMNAILHSSVMAKKSFLETFPYDAAYRSCEDYDVWLRGSSAGHRYKVLGDIVSKYRVHAGGESSAFRREIEDNTLKVISAHWERLLDEPLTKDEQQALGELLYEKGAAIHKPELCFGLLHRLHAKNASRLKSGHVLNKEIYAWWRTAIYRLPRFTPRNWFILRSPMLRQMPALEKASLAMKSILFKKNTLMTTKNHNGKLIFDIGYHEGQDTNYYLKKGYTVIGVDADRSLIEKGQEQYSAAISENRLKLVDKAIYEKDHQEVEFFISDNSEYNSLNRDFAGRNELGTRVEKVTTIRLDSLVQQYGKPFFLKIDIEGYDVHALKTLSPELAPDYISVEALSMTATHIPDDTEATATLRELLRLGYKKFRLIDQTEFAALEPGKPFYGVDKFASEPLWAGLLRKFLLKRGYRMKRFSNREWINVRCGHQFEFGSAGPLPEELDGTWLNAEQAEQTLKYHLREAIKLGMTGFWVDWHGRK